MFQLLPIIDKDRRQVNQEEDQKKQSLQEILITRLRVKKVVDQGCIIMYKAICDNCNGNGHINITDNKGVTEPKQCWMCNSEGEIKYEEDFINKLIINNRQRLH